VNQLFWLQVGQVTESFEHFPQSHQNLLQLQLTLLRRCAQKVDDPDHVTGKQCLVNQDRLLVILRVRDLFVRIPVNAKGVSAENHFPKELLLEFLRLVVEGMPNVLRVHDRA